MPLLVVIESNELLSLPGLEIIIVFGLFFFPPFLQIDDSWRLEWVLNVCSSIYFLL